MRIRPATIAKAMLIGGMLVNVPASHATSISFSCSYHSEWPVRKYDCTGTAVEYSGVHYCSAHWTDDDSNGSWRDYNSRVISISCTGSTGKYSCSEDEFATSWNCSGQGTEGPGTYCSSYSWHDDDPDPFVSYPGYYTGFTGCV